MAKPTFANVTLFCKDAAILMEDLAIVYEKYLGDPDKAKILRQQITELWAPIGAAKKGISETVAPSNSMLPQDKIKGFEDAAVAAVVGKDKETVKGTIFELGLLDIFNQALLKSEHDKAGTYISSFNNRKATLLGNINAICRAEPCSGDRPRSSRANDGVNYIYDFSNLCPKPATGGVTLTAEQMLAGKALVAGCR